jgi:predicted nucleic-acid-binding Zn-ribbon protein
MPKCRKCGSEMQTEFDREYVPNPNSYGCNMKRVIVGKRHKCEVCGNREYEKVSA